MRYTVAIVAILLAGCATDQIAENEPLSAGATRTFIADTSSVAAAVKASLADVGLSLKYEKPRGGAVIIIAERGPTMFGPPRDPGSWGEIVRVMFQPSHSGTIVRILTERAFVMNVTAKDFADDLFTAIGRRLGDFP